MGDPAIIMFILITSNDDQKYSPLRSKPTKISIVSLSLQSNCVLLPATIAEKKESSRPEKYIDRNKPSTNVRRDRSVLCRRKTTRASM